MNILQIIAMVFFVLGLLGSLLLSFVSLFGLPMFLLGMVPVLLLWDKVIKLEKKL